MCGYFWLPYKNDHHKLLTFRHGKSPPRSSRFILRGSSLHATQKHKHKCRHRKQTVKVSTVLTISGLSLVSRLSYRETRRPLLAVDCKICSFCSFISALLSTSISVMSAGLQFSEKEIRDKLRDLGYEDLPPAKLKEFARGETVLLTQCLRLWVWRVWMIFYDTYEKYFYFSC